MNEQQIAYRIKQLLNRGLDLDAGKLARLNAARERALACQRVESRVPVLAWAGNVIGRSGGPSALVTRLLLLRRQLSPCGRLFLRGGGKGGKREAKPKC